MGIVQMIVAMVLRSVFDCDIEEGREVYVLFDIVSCLI